MSDKEKRNIFLSDLRTLLDKHSAVLRIERRFGAEYCNHWIEVDIDGCDEIDLGSYFDCESMEDGDDDVARIVDACSEQAYYMTNFIGWTSPQQDDGDAE